MTGAGLELVGAAVATPVGDLAATLAAIGVPAGDAATTGASAGSARIARLLGPLPARAVELAAAAAAALPAGERTGVFVAAGGLRAHWDDLAPAMAEQVASGEAAWARGLRRLHPLWMLRYLANGAQAAIAHELGFLGDGATFTGAAAAASAIASALAAARAGTIDHAVIVGLDDLTAIEAAVELAARRPGAVGAAGVAAVAVRVTAAPAAGTIAITATDGVDPERAEPGAPARAAARDRLARADAELTLPGALGELGAAAPLVAAALAARCLQAGTWPPPHAGRPPRSVAIPCAGSPGQLGTIRLGVVA